MFTTANLESFPGMIFVTLGSLDNPKGIEPVLEMFTKRRLETGCLALRREQHHAPPSRTKSVWVLPERSLVRIQASTPSNATLSASTQISN